MLKKDNNFGVIFKVVKRRWYHKYFKKPTGGRPLCELSGIKFCVTKNGKYYLDIGGLENVGSIKYHVD